MEVIRGVVTLLAGVGCVFSTTWLGDLDNHKAGFTFRLGYTRPISNLQMVLIPTVYSVANAMLGYLACALLVQLMLGQRMPLLGPSLIFGCLVSVSTAVVWSSTHTAEKLIALFAVVGLSLGLLPARHSLHSGDTPILLAIGKPDFFDLAWYEYLGLFLINSLSLAATIFAVGQQRFGEGVRWSSLVVRAVNAIATQRWWISGRESFEAAIGPRGFRSPVAAQLWFEWRRTVHLLFVSLLCCAGVLMFIVLSALVNETWGGVHAVRMWIGASMFIPFVYQFLATDPVVGLTHKQGSTRLSLFDATRPLRCDQMIAIKLLVVAGWSIFGFLLMVAMASLHTTLAQQWPLWGKVIEEILTGLARVLSGEFKPVAESVVPELAIDWRSIHSLWWLAGLCTFVGLYFSSTAMCLTLVMAICFGFRAEGPAIYLAQPEGLGDEVTTI